MFAQVQFNFGPTSFDRVYQAALPLIPGGILAMGVMLARPGVGSPVWSALVSHPYAVGGAVMLAAYIAGFILFGLSALITGTLSGIAIHVTFRSWNPIRASYSLSKYTLWRQVAARFLGKELTPTIPESVPPTTAMEKINASIQQLGAKTQHDQLWEEWYRILQDYILRDTPLVTNYDAFFWLTLHATGWAGIAVCFASSHERHWPVYFVAAIFILFGSMFPFLATLNYLTGERLTYWTFTAKLLSEVRAREAMESGAQSSTACEERSK